MDMQPNVIINPEKAPMVTTKQLTEAIPSFEWAKGSSGRILTAEQATKLELIWEDYLEKIDDKIDYITINLTHQL